MVFVATDFLVQMALHLLNDASMSAVVKSVFTQILHHALIDGAVPQFEEVLFAT